MTCWQAEPKAGLGRTGRDDFDAASVLLGDCGDDGQSQPRASVVASGGDKALEQPTADIGGNARAWVADFELDTGQVRVAA